ncbi:MAG: hypothetical protein IH988_04705 [Planctomycetes bacterium]|nr:hypothetical protein [Planctomycetota bacterium]
MKLRLPRTIRVAALAFAAATVALTLPLEADHIPGHSNDDPIFPVPIPGQDIFNGGIIFITAIGPLEGSEIFSTEFDITYVSDGATPASDMLIVVGFPTTTEYVEIHVSGADLGFGDGPGTFTGTLTTDALNGITVGSFFPPYSIVNLDIGAVNGQIDGVGYFEDSFIYFDVAGDEVSCDGDANGDGTVDPLDAGFVLARFGCPVGTGDADCDSADQNEDGAVDPLDSGYVLARFGECS